MEPKFFVAADCLINARAVETVLLENNVIHIGYSRGTSPIAFATAEEAYAKYVELAKFLHADALDIGGELRLDLAKTEE